MSIWEKANPVSQLRDQYNDFRGDVSQQWGNIRRGDFRESVDNMVDDLSQAFLYNNASGLVGGVQLPAPFDWNDMFQKDTWKFLEKAVGNYDWEHFADLLGGGGMPSFPGGGGDFPAWPESEKRHTGGPSSGDFYMDIYSGGLEGGGLPSKKYGLGAPENANYRGVLGVY